MTMREKIDKGEYKNVSIDTCCAERFAVMIRSAMEGK